MLDLSGSERFVLFCLLVCIIVVPSFGHGSMVDGKVLYAGKEKWRETLPLRSGSRIYKLEGLKSNAWYEVKISYPASIPASFSLQLLRDGDESSKRNKIRRLLNTEKLIFMTESLEEVNDKGGLNVLVTVEPEGVVAIPNLQERPFIIYNIVCEELLLGIPHSSWSVVILVILCLVVALIVPWFLPSYLLITNRGARSASHNVSKHS
ncbi:PREDICTED: uncharacterized protein LOC104812009 [Tarenaya hassleriana]|uniref:uncharacterized protein LOC104812009 n=1 Tax=Tarenaya hassleriana TaxID=28532 RepID=UPI00053C248F|nr:PREDICTED: uncharacterized protein LOC104812009 [Tarenaya hassleriana]XP_010537236.1 PREDICTED: uncharacterized protein LOC104812009 [Tarenaya hassleriana]XP_010537237.1 PREDICTED: uncharacterized protein LOC104812009 [Tarenaya hassleriana]XP_010537238.1 PREDICTED: uncharacterized protein LOC104812009 [Tarenaya hassleriana]XP_010537239.1 PREDICTED: uncharacterized protein LOC104812009 [Tarenaya hassleriana]